MMNILIVVLVIAVIVSVATKVLVSSVNKKRVRNGSDIIKGKENLKYLLLVGGVTGIGALIGALARSQGWFG